jgi:hypothetical protein
MFIFLLQNNWLSLIILRTLRYEEFVIKMHNEKTEQPFFSVWIRESGVFL